MYIESIECKFIYKIICSKIETKDNKKVKIFCEKNSKDLSSHQLHLMSILDYFLSCGAFPTEQLAE